MALERSNTKTRNHSYRDDNMSPNYAKYERRQKYLNWTLAAYKLLLAVGVVVSIAWLIWGQG